MPGLLIEAGVIFLLFFTPFAFAGVEGWAVGVLQIVAGIVTAAWALDRLARPGAVRPGSPSLSTLPAPGGRAGIHIWLPIALFVLLVTFQLVPLPASWIARLAPATHALYETTLPGYAEGRRFETAGLVPWLLEDQRAALPEGEAAAIPPPQADFGASPYPLSASPRRTLSLYPYDTRGKLSILLCYAGLFAAVLGHYTTRERLTRLALAGCLSAVAVSLVGILQKLTWNGKLLWFRETIHDSPFGPFVERNSYAAFAGVWMPVAAGMAFAALRRVRDGRAEEWPRLLLWGAATVALMGGIFLSLSRGGILSACLAIAVLAGLLVYFGRAALESGVLMLLIAAAAGFLLWIGPEQVLDRIGTLSEGHQVPSLQYRVGTWQRVMPLIAENPLVGTGLGTFRFAFMRYAPPGQGWWTSAHNEYIEVVSDTGLPGGALLLWGALGWLFLVARPSRLKGRPERHLYLGMVAGLAALYVHSGVSSNLQIPANGILVPILGAALVNLVAIASRRGRGGAPARPETAG